MAVTLLKKTQKAAPTSDPIQLYNQLVSALDINSRKIEQAINEISIIQLAIYTTANRPDSSKIPVGSMIFNTSTNIPNFSDGTNWRDAAGTIV